MFIFAHVFLKRSQCAYVSLFVFSVYLCMKYELNPSTDLCIPCIQRII